MTNFMKVFAYLRVSTREQIDGGGFDRQLATILSFTEHRGWDVARTFRDQQSGGTEFDNRGGLRELLSLAGRDSALGVDTIIVENATRIARDLMVQEIFLAECRKLGVKVFAADCGEELVLANADPTRVLIRQILGALAQWEKAQIVLKLQAGRRKKARETGAPCGGPKPYGQTESERAVIGDIWRFRRTNGWTFRRIAQELRAIGYPAPGGRCWHTGTVGTLYCREVARRGADNI